MRWGGRGVTLKLAVGASVPENVATEGWETQFAGIMVTHGRGAAELLHNSWPRLHRLYYVLFLTARATSPTPHASGWVHISDGRLYSPRR